MSAGWWSLFVSRQYVAIRSIELPESAKRYAGDGLPAHLREISIGIGFQFT